MLPRPPISTLFPYTTLFRSDSGPCCSPVRRRPERAWHHNAQSPRVWRQTCGRRLSLRSEEHTSELQSRFDLVCRLLLEKKKEDTIAPQTDHPLTSISNVLDP